MAEEGAEQGYLQSQNLNTDADATAGSDSDDYDPSETIQEQFPANIAASNYNTIPHMSPFASSSTSTPAPGANLPERMPGESYNNNDSTFSLTPSGAEPKGSTTISQIGVFEEGSTGDEDGGDAEYEPPAAALSAQVQNSISTSADMSQRSLSENLNEPVSHFHVQQQNIASDQNTPPVSINLPASDSHVAYTVQNDSAPKPMQGESKTPGRSAIQSANSSLPSTPPVAAAASRTRLPHDRVGILEDRIKADPRGDTEAWLELISEHRSRNKLDSARQVYERFFKVFPSAAEQWVEYATMESENNELYKLEQIFTKCLLSIPNVQLWSLYLDYVRRRNNLTTDTSGDARRTITSAYDLALQHIGIDKDSGNIWVDYIQFLRSGPGNIGGSGWQDQQKMDLLRKAYQRAICIPTQSVNTLWKEYDQFEMGLNKLTGRKFIQDKSPSYMTARSSYTELQNITKELVRSSLPHLPPAPGYEGDFSFSKQVEIWKRWIQWEKDDPLVLKEEDLASYKQRVLYVYKQALMALRFVPEVFFDTADFCFQNSMETEGNDFLKQGIEANPESCLLAFKRADRLELSSVSEQDPKKRGTLVREPYDKLLDALYELIAQVRAQEATDIAKLEEQAAQAEPEQPTQLENDDDDDDDETGNPPTQESAKAKEIESVKKDYAAKVGVLSKAISFVWIALMRAMRRIQGKGKPGEIAGSRQIFADARKRGRITSDIYIASALLEYHCYKDPAATKIFERGAKLFPEDEVFALEYLKHLIDINDITNARAVFETTVRRLASNPKNVAKAKPIFAFLHEYESRYGDLVQINNLEARMRELFPEDPSLKQFSHRFSAPSFDPTTFQPILSPSQLKPRTISSLEEPSSRPNSPSIRHPTSNTHSPKRSFPLDEYSDELNRPRKFIRAESPLKGAAGRREQQKRLQSNGSSGGPTAARKQPQQPPPSAGPLPRDVVYLLSIIPPASTYDATRFSPEMMVNLLRQIELPSSVSQLRLPQQTGAGSHQYPQYGGYRPNV